MSSVVHNEQSYARVLSNTGSVIDFATETTLSTLDAKVTECNTSSLATSSLQGGGLPLLLSSDQLKVTDSSSNASLITLTNIDYATSVGQHEISSAGSPSTDVHTIQGIAGLIDLHQFNQ
jgi:hypothetical protein